MSVASGVVLSLSTPAAQSSSRSGVRGGGRLESLDALRGVAILGVLLYHCLGLAYGHGDLAWSGLWQTTAGESRASFYLLYPLTFGWAGVSLFFVLSGFVIHYSTLHVERFEVRGFYWRRFWRIWPPYLAVLSIVAFLQWRHAALGADRVDVVRQFTVHAAALQNVRARYFFGINPSFWSLATEMQFYLLYPPLLMCRRRAGWGTALGLVLGVSTSFRVVAYAMTDWRGPMAPETVTWYATPALWPDWVLGMYLAERYRSGRRLFQRPGMWAGAMAVLLVAASTFKPTSVLCFTIASVLGAVATEAAVWGRPGGAAVAAATAGAGRSLWRLAGRALAGLGVVSYSFYLWHQPLLSKIFVRTRIASVRDPEVRMVLLVCASLAVVWGVSYLSYHLLERPSQEVGRQMARRLGIWRGRRGGVERDGVRGVDILRRHASSG